MQGKIYLLQYWIDDFGDSELRTIFATTDKEYAEAYASKFNSKLQKLHDFVNDFYDKHPEIYDNYENNYLHRFRYIEELVCPCKITEVKLR
jgi:hypothetical protein